MMKSNSKLIIGYVTPRPFGQFSMPVPAQNSCLREYAVGNGFSYAIPQCEHIFKDCYVQWFGTMNSAQQGQDIVIYSLLMLPTRGSDIEAMIEIMESKSLTIHSVLEKTLLRTRDDFFSITNLRKIANINQQRDQL